MNNPILIQGNITIEDNSCKNIPPKIPTIVPDTTKRNNLFANCY
jgi:hypothetical protein